MQNFQAAAWWCWHSENIFTDTSAPFLFIIKAQNYGASLWPRNRMLGKTSDQKEPNPTKKAYLYPNLLLLARIFLHPCRWMQYKHIHVLQLHLEDAIERGIFPKTLLSWIVLFSNWIYWFPPCNVNTEPSKQISQSTQQVQRTIWKGEQSSKSKEEPKPMQDTNN